jgi:hypothetical protein
MQRKGLLALLGFLALALAAAPALAGTVSFSATHDFSVLFIDPSTLDLSAFATGTAFGSTSQGPDSSSATGNPSNAAIPTGPYLVTTQAITSANSTTTMKQTMVANAPDALFGSTFQQTNNDALFTFTAPSTPPGVPIFAFVTDTYTQQFSLANTGPWVFSSLSTFSDLYATMTDTTTGQFSQAQSPYNFLTFDVDNLGVPLENFTDSVANSLSFFIFLTGVAEGDIITLDLNLDSTQSGGSTDASVPLPPTFLLLGSGLGGLLLARRWRFV